MVDIIPKQIKKPLPLQKIAFYAAVFLLSAAILSYAVLIYFQNKALGEIDDLKVKISQVGTPQDKDSEKTVLDYQKKIEDFAHLLKERRLASGFFESFENMVHPKVWFPDFELNIRNGRAALDGRADNFQTLGQQFDIFKKQEEIRQVSLSEVGIGKDGGADFSLVLSFASTTFASK